MRAHTVPQHFLTEDPVLQAILNEAESGAPGRGPRRGGAAAQAAGTGGQCRPAGGRVAVPEERLRSRS